MLTSVLQEVMGAPALGLSFSQLRTQPSEHGKTVSGCMVIFNIPVGSKSNKSTQAATSQIVS